MATERETIFLDGETLIPEQLVQLARGTFRIDLSEEAWERVRASRVIIDRILASGEVVYGINTGFGNFSSVVVSQEKLCELQENLIRSHAAGVGSPLSRPRTRMLLALRVNVLAKGHSGISPDTLQQALDAFNADCLSVVPSKGTVGASGDLAPLSHLALGLMGEGDMWDPRTGRPAPASEVLAEHGLRPIRLKAKEGLAMINGTQLIASLGSEAVVRARNVARQADVVTAMTLEALLGSVRAFHPSIHRARPHSGQMLTARRLRALLHSPAHPSEIATSHKHCKEVQDSYTMRCAPQVHGVVHDTIDFVYNTLCTELNSATDNPMVFTGVDVMAAEVAAMSGSGAVVVPPAGAAAAAPSSAAASAAPSDAAPRPAAKPAPSVASVPGAKATDGKTRPEPERAKHMLASLPRSNSFSDKFGGFVISGGNFHGEYPAKMMDFLAIAVHEISNISERRIERLVNPALSKLPAFLTPEGGLNSGFMIAHCTAAALVSENKGLCHPASVDSLSTSAAKEDHVSMGGFAARKAVKVVEHVETVVAIELLCACQGIDFLRPLRTTPALEAVHALVRSVVPPWDKDRYMARDIELATQLIRSGRVWEVVLPHLEEDNDW